MCDSFGILHCGYESRHEYSRHWSDPDSVPSPTHQSMYGRASPAGVLVIDPGIHQDWAGAGDLAELDKPELHETIAEQRGVSTGVVE